MRIFLRGGYFLHVQGHIRRWRGPQLRAQHRSSAVVAVLARARQDRRCAEFMTVTGEAVYAERVSGRAHRSSRSEMRRAAGRTVRRPPSSPGGASASGTSDCARAAYQRQQQQQQQQPRSVEAVQASVRQREDERRLQPTVVIETGRSQP